MRSRRLSGALELLADAAAVHGSAIRCMDDGGQRVVGDWTDAEAFVTWEIAVPAAGTYVVEIRYGCPEECSGSRYASASTAQRISSGRSGTPATGRHCHRGCRSGGCAYPPAAARVAVRAIDKVADAVMALHGVRLVPAS